MRGSNEELCFSEKKKDRLDGLYGKDHENELDRDVEGNIVERPVVCESRLQLVQALTEVKTGNASGASEVSLELIAASVGVGIYVLSEICQRARCIWHASRIDSKYSYSNLQLEG